MECHPERSKNFTKRGLAESKDPDDDVVRVASEGILATAVAREFPEAPLVVHGYLGSFDYVGVRLANANFAQDDKL